MFNPNIPSTGHGHHSRGRPIIIDDDDDDDDDDDNNNNNGGMQVDYPQHPHMAYGHNASASTGTDRMPSPGYPAWHTALEQEKKVRSRMREERHAALCVLLDRELLTLQALANQETLPQARRRFLSKLLAPGDAEEAAKIRADRFIIQHPSASSSSSSVSMTVSRGIVDVHETDDGGWRRPDAASGSGSAVSSPASSVKKKGRETPERARSKAKGSASRQQQPPERERRRRSGVEREDPGSPSLQRFSP